VTVLSAPSTSIGAKRNLGIGRARGAIIAQWDDDDWYSDARLTQQIVPILRGEADITGLEAGVFFDLEAWSFWRLTPELHRRLFVSDVHGGTLVYRRHIWERLSRYPNGSLGEDALFLRTAQRGGARLLKLRNDGLFVYLRHGANAWSFPLGRYLDPHGWLPSGEPLLPDRDRAFYEAMRRRFSSTSGTATLAQPLVTCIMPTYNRRHYVPQAIRYFLRQDYPNRELLILDDGDERVADLVPNDARLRYVALPVRMILGAKRNRACELAAGEIIAHWDDDDWMAPHRLSYQVRTLREAGADLCGAPRQLYYDPVRDRAWLYEYRRGASLADRRYIAGNTLCYRKSFWRGNPFPEIQIGEDTRFLWSNQARNLIATPESDYYVGLLHATNTSPKSLGAPYWRTYPVEQVHQLMGEDLSFYRQPHGVPGNVS
jgi:glycosyltransferase involved in cell wall biosynthesis